MNALKEVGNQMFDNDFVMCTLACVGPTYNFVVTIITSRLNNMLHFKVYSILLIQENSVEHNHVNVGLEAHYAQMKRSKKELAKQHQTNQHSFILITSWQSKPRPIK